MFVAIVGPSGAGKDSLLRHAARALAARHDFLFARRVITRMSDGASEDHDTLSADAFEAALMEGAFCLSWRAHGLAYALPRSVLDAVGQGRTAIANISRAALGDASRTFGRLAVIEVTADPLVLAQRVASRGRESADDVGQRIARSVPVLVPAGCAHVQVDNSSTLEAAGARFLQLLLALSQASRLAARI